jgi:hypothetical protein
MMPVEMHIISKAHIFTLVEASKLPSRENAFVSIHSLQRMLIATRTEPVKNKKFSKVSE